MKNILITLLAILLLFGAYGLGFWYGSYEKEIPNNNDSIVYEILIQNDSLIHANDSISNKIKEIEESYEKTVTNILSNDVHSDYNFFEAYTRRYSGNYNSVAAEAN